MIRIIRRSFTELRGMQYQSVNFIYRGQQYYLCDHASSNCDGWHWCLKSPDENTPIYGHATEDEILIRIPGKRQFTLMQKIRFAIKAMG